MSIYAPIKRAARGIQFTGRTFGGGWIWVALALFIIFSFVL